MMVAERGTPSVTVGLDLGDKYSCLCLIDTDTGKVLQEGRLRTTPETFRRRFDSEQRMTVAIEAGTHSPWVSRALEEGGHKVLVANPRKTRLISMDKDERPTSWMPRSWLVWPEWTPSCSRRWSTGERHLRRTWRSSARARCWSAPAFSSLIMWPRNGQVFWGSSAQVLYGELSQEASSVHTGGARAGLRAPARDHRVAEHPYPPLRPRTRGTRPRALSRDQDLRASAGSRDADGFGLCAHTGGPNTLQRE
jgi:hypothetical protein